ncbi:MAG: hypothetical protein B7Y31_05235 [Novosphingobium sp. 16-62-11]|nr:MAG: hypothetical protein B7Y31_05235 [Novosphingobium sp. 16-62-11]
MELRIFGARNGVERGKAKRCEQERGHQRELPARQCKGCGVEGHRASTRTFWPSRTKPAPAVMTRAVVTCTADETVPAIMERMTRGRFRHVPVVSGSKLVGIISIGDVVKYRVEEMERESAELRDYIMTA